MDQTGHIIGIDLGTTNSVVAVLENGEPRAIRNAEGQPKTPSVVAIMDDGEIVVGEIARRQAATHPERTVSSAKRLLGRQHSEIVKAGEHYAFPLVENPDDGCVLIKIGDREYHPHEFSALVLGKLKEAAEEELGEPVTRAVVTVPAYFDDLQRQATKQAAEMAGLEVMRLLNEPTAAAMAYGLEREGEHIVAVYDFGGGTFDFSVLDVDGKTFEVLVSTGDSQLGGNDLDRTVVDYLADRFLDEQGLDLRGEPAALRRLTDEAERAKCELSSAVETLISLPFITSKDGQPVHFEARLTRDLLEELIEDSVQDTLNCCARALRERRLKKSDISRVILVGGSTRIPFVQEMVEDFFGIAPFKGLNPDEIVAQGAATQAGVLNGELDEVVLLDVTPHTLGIEIKGNRRSTLIEKNSTIPVKTYKTFTTTEDDQSFVNIHALQGDEDRASECRSVGKFTLSGIEKSPAGNPRVRVTFFINADGILEISAEDMNSGVNKSLTITHAFLSGDERRAQSDRSQRRRRRRSGARPSADALGRPSTVSDAGGEEASGKADTGGRSRGSLATTFTEISGDTDRKPSRRRRQPAQSPDEARPDSAPAPAAAPEAAVAEGQGEAPQHAAAQPEQIQAQPKPEVPEAAVAVAQHASTDPGLQPSEALADTEGPRKPDPRLEQKAREIAGAQVAKELSTQIPAELEPIVTYLIASACDAAAVEAYSNQADSFVEFCSEHGGDANLQLMLARFHIFTKQAEEAREVLERLQMQSTEHDAPLLETYSLLCSEFPNYIAARKDRSALAAAAGDFHQAMEDLEFVAKRDDGDGDILDRLAQIYEMMLEEDKEATIQFKLVKLHLKRQEVDDAITLLQQMVVNPEYRDRANKVLGLCFWQKGMRYLAWQKFRGLPATSEMKDILYRLADDMELNDELLHAKYCLERVFEVDIGYRDVQERLKKLSDRLELQKDDRYASVNAHQPTAIEEENVMGRFELQGELNRGSMGIVYKARDTVLDEIVAIKVLNDFLCTDPQAIDRFKLEARSARKLTHQNIVRIHDFYEVEGKQLISMEFIEGENLKTLLARNATIAEDTLLNLLLQICEGLAFAHRLHVVHRDIKPANIMLTDRNQVKITDFGIAKLLEKGETKAGTMVMGTPLYMAPEQIEGGRIDHRCDIYSLGIMLYELVSGSPPFNDGNIEYQHIHSRAPSIEVGATDKLKGVIMKCIEKNPDDRFQSVEEILARVV